MTRRLSLTLAAAAALATVPTATAGTAMGKGTTLPKGYAGKYSGTTEEGQAMSFTLTRRGVVTGFSAPTTLLCFQPAPPPPAVQPPPTTMAATVTFAPVKLTPVVLRPGVPPKKFQFFSIGPGGTPPGTVNVYGKSAGRGRFQGNFFMDRVQQGTATCRMRNNGESGGLGKVSFTARR